MLIIIVFIVIVASVLPSEVLTEFTDGAFFQFSFFFKEGVEGLAVTASEHAVFSVGLVVAGFTSGPAFFGEGFHFFVHLFFFVVVFLAAFLAFLEDLLSF